MNESLEGKTLAQKLRKVHTHTHMRMHTDAYTNTMSHTCMHQGWQADSVKCDTSCSACLCRAAFTKP